MGDSTVPVVICPICNRKAVISLLKNGALRWDCHICSMVTTDPTKPMISYRTVTARKRAHAAIDVLWKGGGPGQTEAERRLLLGRARAYELLAEEMDLLIEEVHLSNATLEVALAVPAAVKRVQEKLLARTASQIQRDYRDRREEIAANRRRS